MIKFVNYGRIYLFKNIKFISNFPIKRYFGDSISIINKNSNLINIVKTDLSLNNFQIKEPLDYRTIYLDNLPTDWNDDEIRVRLEQLGKIEKLHIIKNSIGIKTGRVIAVYSTMESLVGAINSFKDKMPFFKPVKIRFFREFKIKKALPIKNNIEYKSDVLLIKNIPSDLHKDDMHLFLSEFKEPIHISYLRDEENEFKRVALVYFYTIEDAEYVLKYANLRYVKNKQLFFHFSVNHWDITDFRTRAELGIKLPPSVQLKLFNKQIENYKLMLENNGEYTDSDLEKIEYLKTQSRKLEYQVKGMGGELPLKLTNYLTKETKKIYAEPKKKLKFEYNDDKSMIFVDRKSMFKK